MTLIVATFMTCVVILYVKFLATTGLQAIKTFEAGGRSPEDNDHPLARGKPRQNYGLHQDNPNDAALAQARAIELRWKRIVLNDLEAIPLGLVVFGAGILADAEPKVHAGAMLVFTIARCGHTLAYAQSRQPHRAWCWRMGVLAILVGCVNGLIGAFGRGN